MMLHRLLQGLRKPPTEAPPPLAPDMQAMAAGHDRVASHRLGRGLSVRMVDAGSCNGCDPEIHLPTNAFPDPERYGLSVVASPRHADGDRTGD